MDALTAGPFVWNSLWVGAVATLVIGPFALGCGYILARYSFPGKTFLSTLTLVPLVLPPVVTGYLLLEGLGPRSALGHLLENTFNVSIAFSPMAAVVAAMAMGFPLFVATARVSFQSVPVALEEMAATSGASKWIIFRKVTLPLAWPGILAGALLSFARGLGEFGATVIVAGHLPREEQTLPLAVYEAIDRPGGEVEAWTLAGASLGVSLLILWGYERLTRLTAVGN